ncbi:MAG: AraC family transcriptional regulator [Ruminococcaceae bacterium]|nr:AraC family transcriptional regulator [Oscillospiraceae bacterium]
MKNKNICKFIPASTSEKIEIYCFIYESNQETMRLQTRLHSNRAILVKQGKGIFQFDDRSVEFGAGSLVFGFEQELFSTVSEDVCEYMYIDFGGMRSEVLFRRFGISQNHRSFAGFDGILPLWRDSLSRASQENIDLASESMLLYIFSRLVGADSEQNHLIGEILEITESQFSDSELSITTIAGTLSYNPKYLSHLFKGHMGMGYSEYLRTVRMKYAISLFDHGIDSVKNVAFLSGFHDPLYFSTVFKKAIGISPKEYIRKTNRG